MHVSSVQVFPEDYEDCTLFQQHFLALMAVHEINHERSVDNKLNAICEVLGIKIKEKN